MHCDICNCEREGISFKSNYELYSLCLLIGKVKVKSSLILSDHRASAHLMFQ